MLLLRSTPCAAGVNSQDRVRASGCSRTCSPSMLSLQSRKALTRAQSILSGRRLMPNSFLQDTKRSQRLYRRLAAARWQKTKGISTCRLAHRKRN